MTGACWNSQEAQLHINSLEMMADFCHQILRQQISIMLLTDNISEVAHVNKMGGTKSLHLISQVRIC